MTLELKTPSVSPLVHPTCYLRFVPQLVPLRIYYIKSVFLQVTLDQLKPILQYVSDLMNSCVVMVYVSLVMDACVVMMPHVAVHILQTPPSDNAVQCRSGNWAELLFHCNRSHCQRNGQMGGLNGGRRSVDGVEI